MLLERSLLGSLIWDKPVGFKTYTAECHKHRNDKKCQNDVRWWQLKEECRKKITGPGLSLEEHHRLEKQGYRIICQQSNTESETPAKVLF